MMSRRFKAPYNPKHTSGNLIGSFCNGCPMLDIKDWEADSGGNPRMIDGARRHPYYCDKLKRALSRGECYTMSEDECHGGWRG